MEHKKISELTRLTWLFPLKALNFWNARKERNRIELYQKLTDADLTLKSLLLEKKIRPYSDSLERWIRVQAKLVDYYGRKYEKASRKIVKEVFQ